MQAKIIKNSRQNCLRFLTGEMLASNCFSVLGGNMSVCLYQKGWQLYSYSVVKIFDIKAH